MSRKLRKALIGELNLHGEKLLPHSGEEIAQYFKMTRQNVSQTLKRSMAKSYDSTRKLHPEYSPFEIAQEMMEMFGVDDDDASNFFNLFPDDYKDKIRADAAKRLPASRQKVAKAEPVGIKFPKLPSDKYRAAELLYYMFTKYDEEDIPELPKEYITFLAKMDIPAGDNDEIAGYLKRYLDKNK